MIFQIGGTVRVAMIVFSACLMMIAGLVFSLDGIVEAGPLNVEKFFAGQVESEFSRWSILFLRTGSCDDGILSYDDFKDFASRYGVVSVKRLSDDNSVDWTLDAYCRMLVHYVCRIKDDNPAWDFRVGSADGHRCEDVLPKVMARRANAGKWLALSICCFMIVCGVQVLCKKSKFSVLTSSNLRIAAILSIWLANVVVLFVLSVWGGTTCSEWMRLHGRNARASERVPQ